MARSEVRSQVGSEAWVLELFDQMNETVVARDAAFAANDLYGATQHTEVYLETAKYARAYLLGRRMTAIAHQNPENINLLCPETGPIEHHLLGPKFAPQRIRQRYEQNPMIAYPAMMFGKIVGFHAEIKQLEVKPLNPFNTSSYKVNLVNEDDQPAVRLTLSGKSPRRYSK